MSEHDPAVNRLRWRCRRGMRELDVLLGRYLDERWPHAQSAERAAFERFLELPDPEIYDLCLRRSVSADAAMTRMAELLSESKELSDSREVSTAEDVRSASREP
jgi:antitoxin CptB